MDCKDMKVFILMMKYDDEESDSWHQRLVRRMYWQGVLNRCVFYIGDIS